MNRTGHRLADGCTIGDFLSRLSQGREVFALQAGEHGQFHLVRAESWDSSVHTLGSFRQIEPLKSLKLIDLSLSGPGLDASAVEELADLKTLTSLKLHGVDLNGVDLSVLSRLPSLERLMLVRCNLHDDDLRPLAKLPKLRELLIARNPITDKCVESLPQCLFLERVDLYETEVTPIGIEALESRKPACVFLGH